MKIINRQDEPALQEGFPTAGDWRRQGRQEKREETRENFTNHLGLLYQAYR
ncbi:hypothetical protein [Scytonema sp. PRP1]|uniref:hypothetical protein n=1 Tax=Scytonema sp. PRP1 TaxID=3120513 RepID=UPI002FD718D1